MWLCLICFEFAFFGGLCLTVGCGFGLLLLVSWCVSVACFSYDADCCLWLIVLILWFLLLEYLCLVGDELLCLRLFCWFDLSSL